MSSTNTFAINRKHFDYTLYSYIVYSFKAKSFDCKRETYHNLIFYDYKNLCEMHRWPQSRKWWLNWMQSLNTDTHTYDHLSFPLGHPRQHRHCNSDKSNRAHVEHHNDPPTNRCKASNQLCFNHFISNLQEQFQYRSLWVRFYLYKTRLSRAHIEKRTHTRILLIAQSFLGEWVKMHFYDFFKSEQFKRAERHWVPL